VIILVNKLGDQPMKCIYEDEKGYCKILSDNEVKQPCINGPCDDEIIREASQ